MNVGQWSTFRLYQAAARPEVEWLLNIDIGSKTIGAKSCLQTSLESMCCVTPDFFWYGGETSTRNNFTLIDGTSQYRRGGFSVGGGIKLDDARTCISLEEYFDDPKTFR